MNPKFPLNQQRQPEISADLQMKLQKLSLAREIIGNAKFDLVSMSTMDCTKAVHAAIELAEIFDRRVRDQLKGEPVSKVTV